MDGVVVCDKPSGLTSHDVVNRVRRLFGQRRVGHAGTLDPMATGVLVVCLGQATRLADLLTAGRKTYVTRVRLGVCTDSLDVTGTTLEEQDAGHLCRTDIEHVLARFQGRILQVPPMLSARHHQGERLYDLARRGQVVERAATPVDLYSLTLLDFQAGSRPGVDLRVECSAGTYIRSLAADIGAALGVGGCMESLRRTASGRFTEDGALTLEALERQSAAGTMASVVLPMAEAATDLPCVHLNAEAVRRLCQGNPIPAPASSGPGECPPKTPALPNGAAAQDGPPPGVGQSNPVGNWLAVLDEQGALVALAREREGQIWPGRVLRPSGDDDRP